MTSLLRASRSAALLLVFVGCSQSLDDSASSTGDAISSAKSALPSCANGPVVKGVDVFRDAKRSNIFYAAPDTWAIDPIAFNMPLVSSSSGAWHDDAAAKVAIRDRHEISLHASAGTSVPLATLAEELKTLYPDVSGIEVLPLPLVRDGKATFTLPMLAASDVPQVDVAEGAATTLDVTAKFATYQGQSGVLTFFVKRAPAFSLAVPASFQCAGGTGHRTLHLNAGPEITFPGKDVTVTDEAQLVSYALAVVNAFESILVNAGIERGKGMSVPSSSVEADLRREVDAAVAPVLDAEAAALHSPELTQKTAADLKSIVLGYYAKLLVARGVTVAEPEAHLAQTKSDWGTLDSAIAMALDRTEALADAKYQESLEPFQK